MLQNIKILKKYLCVPVISEVKVKQTPILLLNLEVIHVKIENVKQSGWTFIIKWEKNKTILFFEQKQQII